MLVGTNAPGRANQARQVEGKKSGKCSETLVGVATGRFVQVADEKYPCISGSGRKINH